MKVALISDTHAGARNDSPIFNEYFIRFYEQLFFPYLTEHNIKKVVHLGDVFDRRKYINFNILSSWNQRVFQPLYDQVDSVDIILGNHDTYFKNTNEINSVDQLLQVYSNKFKVFKNAQVVSLGAIDKVLYVPWMCDDNIESSMNLIQNTDAMFCFGHLELLGFEMFAGHENTDRGLSPSIFDKFYHTFSGHFHHRSTKNSITYLGSPYPMTWADYGDSRGFHVFDTHTKKLEFIEFTESIFKKIIYNDSNENEIQSIIKNIDALNATNRFIKIVVKNKNNPYFFEKLQEVLTEKNPADIHIVDISAESGNIDEDTFNETKDTLTLLKEYIDSLDINNAERVYTTIRELYSEALTITDKNYRA
jgi:DNA repair exonuclease SbcCD nuclease subunit